LNRFTALAAAITLAATLSSVTAKAEYYFGPLQNGSQCWNKLTTSGFTNAGWGYWGACPQAASTTAAPAVKKKKKVERQ
jgi:hypothetical protein